MSWPLRVRGPGVTGESTLRGVVLFLLSGPGPSGRPRSFPLLQGGGPKHAAHKSGSLPAHAGPRPETPPAKSANWGWGAFRTRSNFSHTSSPKVPARHPHHRRTRAALRHSQPPANHPQVPARRGPPPATNRLFAAPGLGGAWLRGPACCKHSGPRVTSPPPACGSHSTLPARLPPRNRFSGANPCSGRCARRVRGLPSATARAAERKGVVGWLLPQTFPPAPRTSPAWGTTHPSPLELTPHSKKDLDPEAKYDHTLPHELPTQRTLPRPLLRMRPPHGQRRHLPPPQPHRVEPHPENLLQILRPPPQDPPTARAPQSHLTRNPT